MRPNSTACAVAMVLCAAGIRHTSGADAPTIGDVKAAWKARQDATRAFRAEWVETVKEKAGSRRLNPQIPGPHPPEDTEYTVTHSFASDGARAADTYAGQWYNASKKSWHPQLEAHTFEAGAAMSAHSLAEPGWMSVTIEKGKVSPLSPLDSVANGPLRKVYRPFGVGPSVVDDFDRFKLSGRTEKIGGAVCVELVFKDVPKNDAIADYGYGLWCDPARGFLPVRAKLRTGFDGFDTNWDYRKDERGRWVPTGWEHREIGADGKVARTSKAVVKTLDLEPRFAADAFAPKPAPGSRVTVVEDGQEKDEYLIRPDKSERRIKASERTARADELAKTNADGTPYVPAKK